METHDGRRFWITFQVTNVARPIASVADLNDQGATAVLGTMPTLQFRDGAPPMKIVKKMRSFFLRVRPMPIQRVFEAERGEPLAMHE